MKVVAPDKEEKNFFYGRACSSVWPIRRIYFSDRTVNYSGQPSEVSWNTQRCVLCVSHFWKRDDKSVSSKSYVYVTYKIIYTSYDTAVLCVAECLVRVCPTWGEKDIIFEFSNWIGCLFNGCGGCSAAISCGYVKELVKMLQIGACWSGQVRFTFGPRRVPFISRKKRKIIMRQRRANSCGLLQFHGYGAVLLASPSLILQTYCLVLIKEWRNYSLRIKILIVKKVVNHLPDWLLFSLWIFDPSFRSKLECFCCLVVRCVRF